MDRLALQETQQLVDIARSHGVTYLALFGSVARGEERPDSDVDLAVRFGRRVTLFDLVDLQLRFQKILARSVDLIPVDDIYSFMHDSLNRDRVVLYDAANHPPNSPKIPANVSTSRSRTNSTPRQSSLALHRGRRWTKETNVLPLHLPHIRPSSLVFRL